MLVKEDNPILKKVCQEVDFQTTTKDERQELVDRMVATMSAHNGIGLAAPQIGESKRVFIIIENNVPICCFNPQIVHTIGDNVVDYEGCLSFPKLWLKVARTESVVGKYQDIDGNEVERQFDGLTARCFLHELDHVNGVVFVDRVGAVALSMAKKRRTKQQRQK
jgi:peptide deformylase